MDHQSAYRWAREAFRELGVDTDQVLDRLAEIQISLHCWQGDDVQGFEHHNVALGGGLAVTGNYPGRARTPDELRADLEQAYALIPGKHRLNLHACYGEFPQQIDRDAIEPSHFQAWIDWAKDVGLGLDFNPTFFSHVKADDGFTLSHPDPAVREFWIEHGKRCREIGAEMGRQLQTPCVTNVWIPDGFKDTPVDRVTPRARLTEALDDVFSKSFSKDFLLDSVECKLFGLGSESYVVGSHEFYLGYALSRQKLLCLDAGHFHPTESIADKISSVLNFLDQILLHVSRGVRWDSDHVVTMTDDLRLIAQELVRGNFLNRVHVGLDFFDASINRVAAWVIGGRNMMKSLLLAMLEPIDLLRQAEERADLTTRLALLETVHTLPVGIVWDQHCRQQSVPTETKWLNEVQQYEADVLSLRN